MRHRLITHFSAVQAGVLLALGLTMTAMTLVGASVAQAKPFGISSFSLAAIERTSERVTSEEFSGSVRVYGIEYENDPYATPFTQAGGHPWALTTKFAFETEEIQDAQHEGQVLPTHDPKDIVDSLPPGLLGDPMAVPRCPLARATGQRRILPRCYANRFLERAPAGRPPDPRSDRERHARSGPVS